MYCTGDWYVLPADSILASDWHSLCLTGRLMAHRIYLLEMNFPEKDDVGKKEWVRI